MGFPPPFFRWRPHPWHGLETGPDAPAIVQAYIEITPFDLVKYEIDKATGYLYIDRPQRSSSQPPMLYGFVPRTYCGNRIGALNPTAEKGDCDPLDICVLSERPINRSEVLLHARVVGGLQATDGDEADDKIIAVLDNDKVFDNVRDIRHLPDVIVERLRHYFLTYKMIPGQESTMSIEKVYGCEQAKAVVQASMEDYEEEFGS
jgi:inorganic pyrophosphatase